MAYRSQSLRRLWETLKSSFKIVHLAKWNSHRQTTPCNINDLSEVYTLFEYFFPDWKYACRISSSQQQLFQDKGTFTYTLYIFRYLIYRKLLILICRQRIILGAFTIKNKCKKHVKFNIIVKTLELEEAMQKLILHVMTIIKPKLI